MPRRRGGFFNSHHLTLRNRLVILLLSVTIVGLSCSSLAVHIMMKSYLMRQVDEELVTYATALTMPGEQQLLSSDTVRSLMPQDLVVQFLNPYRPFDSSIMANERYLLNREFLPDTRPLRPGELTTLDSVGGSTLPKWRSILIPNEQDYMVIVSRDLTSQQEVLGRLGWVQVGISVLVLALIAVVGTLLIRRSFVPLKQMEETARAIASGEIHRRVPNLTPDTEVGQLAMAFNVMLARLQDSLDTTNRSLQVARDKEEQMRRFVGDASHELRTPLTSVRGYVELYRVGATDDIDRVLDKIDEESGRMKLLVEDLLALTRAEGTRLEKRPVDMLELLSSTVSSAQAAWPEREISIENDSSAVRVVNGDPDRLHQVFINLINNALKHGGEDAKVTVRLHSLADKPGCEVIDVIDDGIGMDEETAKHIFERFYRADSSRNRGTGGSGLGLAIVRSLVEQHGGTVTVSSVEGEGSTFRVVLPEISAGSLRRNT